MLSQFRVKLQRVITSSVLELDEQGVLPSGDAVHPSEADASGAGTDPGEHVGNGFVIHRSVLFLGEHAIDGGRASSHGLDFAP